MSVIDEVKQKTDIVEVVSQFTTLTKAGRTFRALCPFHTEKTPSFFVYPEQQSWHCFGACNTGGDVFSFIMKQQGIDFGEALRLFARKAGMNVPSMSEPETKPDEKARLYEANEAATQYFHNLLLNSPAGEKTRNYLANRGVSAKTITDFQLGFSLNSWESLRQYLSEKGYAESEMLEAGLVIKTEEGKTHDRFRNRLMFPIRDSRGRVTGFGGRVLDDSLPKYLNSPQTPIFDKSNSLYGINLAAPTIRKQNQVVIVEGYMDVVIAHQYGFSNVVASLGTAITDKQITTLKRLTNNVVLALDADSAGEEAMLRCVNYENSLDSEIRVVVLPAGKDPDDVIKQDSSMWQRLLQDALPVIDYTFEIVASQLDLTKARDKVSAVDKLLPIVAEIQNPVRQAHYLQKLSRLVRVSERSLETTLMKSRTRPNKYSQRTVLGRNQKPLTSALQPLLSNTIEEHCLALLLKHPELKDKSRNLLPEYFENSENREIFNTWQQTSDPSSLKDNLDSTLWEHLDNLVNKSILANKVEERYNNYILRLREEYFRGIERKREAIFALEVEAGGSGADLVKLKEEGIEPSIRLGEIFAQKARRGQEQGDKK